MFNSSSLTPSVLAEIESAARFQAPYLDQKPDTPLGVLPPGFLINHVFLSAAPAGPKGLRFLTSFFASPVLLTPASFSCFFWLSAACWTRHLLPATNFFPSSWIPGADIPGTGGHNAARYLWKTKCEIEHDLRLPFRWYCSNGRGEYCFTLRPQILLIDWNSIAFHPHDQIASLAKGVYKYLTGKEPDLGSSRLYN